MFAADPDSASVPVLVTSTLPLPASVPPVQVSLPVNVKTALLVVSVAPAAKVSTPSISEFAARSGCRP